MKQFLTATLLSIIILGCKDNASSTEYTINGSAKEVYNGVRVYLNTIDEKGKQVILDTAIVMNEEFEFNGAVEHPSIHFVSANGISGKKPFMLENNTIEFILDKNNIVNSEIIGSKSNDAFTTYQNDIKTLNEKNQALMVEYRMASQDKDSKKMDSLKQVIQSQNEKANNYGLTFAENNPDTFFSLNLIDFELSKARPDLISIKDVFGALSNELKNSTKGNEVKQKIDELIKENEKLAYLEIGNKAPTFEAPNPDGENVSLENVKGKVTIIDFWAAWCGPCRKENPNVVRIYDKYHDSGLEIIGVSLDGTSRQKDPKQAWLDAIEKDNLKWTHVSNLNYFNDPVAKLYNINAIPATYILDKNGIIVAKNLRGKALEDKVKELLEM